MKVPSLPANLPSQTTIGQHITGAIISVLTMTTVAFSLYNLVRTIIWYVL